MTSIMHHVMCFFASLKGALSFSLLVAHNLGSWMVYTVLPNIYMLNIVTSLFPRSYTEVLDNTKTTSRLNFIFLFFFPSLKNVKKHNKI